MVIYLHYKYSQIIASMLLRYSSYLHVPHGKIYLKCVEIKIYISAPIIYNLNLTGKQIEKANEKMMESDPGRVEMKYYCNTCTFDCVLCRVLCRKFLVTNWLFICYMYLFLKCTQQPRIILLNH